MITLKRFFFLFTIIIISINRVSCQNPLGKFIDFGESVVLNNILYFVADDGMNGLELWRSDGTIEGTYLLKDINKGYRGSGIANLTVFKDEIYFTAYDEVHSDELWKSDGTKEGTILIKDIKPETDTYYNGSYPGHFIVAGNYLYFTAEYGESSYHYLFKTDGTADGTIPVKEIGYYDITSIVKADDKLFYIQFGGPNSFWKVELSNDSVTQVIIDDNYFIDELNSFNNELYLITNTTYRQNIWLWRYLPQNDSLIGLKEFTAPNYGEIDIDNFYYLNNNVYFTIRTDSGVYDNYTDALWKTDGTPQGTEIVKIFKWNRHSYQSEISNFFSFNSTLFFRGNSYNGYKLWQSDGTLSGTKEFFNIIPEWGPNKVLVFGPKFYFSGSSDSYGDYELWESDGTPGGTKKYLDITPGGSSLPSNLRGAGDYFYLTTGTQHSFTLWNNKPKPEINVVNVYSDFNNNGLINFNKIAVDSVVSRNIFVKNDGKKELIISDINVTGKDFFLKYRVPKIILPGEKDTLVLCFFPSSEGTKNGAIELFSNDPDEPRFVINLAGQGTLNIKLKNSLNSEINVNQVPENDSLNKNIVLSNYYFPENSSLKSFVGRLSVPGLNGSSLIYSFDKGVGDENNPDFSISNDSLFLNTVFDFEKVSTASVKVVARKNGDSLTSEILILKIKDITENKDFGICGYTFENLSYSLNSVKFISENLAFVFGNGGVILRSKDAGKTWEKRPSPTNQNLIKSCFINNTGYVLGDYNTLLKTEDGGENWFPLDIKNPDYPYPTNLYFLNKDTGIVIGGGGKIFITFNGGKDWNYKTGVADLNAVHIVNDTLAFICGRSNTLLRTTDLGKNWQTINMSGLGWSLNFSDIFFTKDGTGLILSADGQIFRSIDFGKTWNSFSQVYSDYAQRIYFINDLTGFILGGWSYMTFFKTTDGGQSWDVVPGNSGYYKDISFSPSKKSGLVVGQSSSIGYSSEPGRVISYTDDSGKTWSKRCRLDASLFFNDITFFDDSVGYVVGGGRYQKTIDGGITWEGPEFYAQSDIRMCDFLNKDVGFLVADSVYKTTDGGNTWKILPSIPGSQLSTFHFINENTGFYSNYIENGIFKTLDGGLNWVKVCQLEFWLKDMFFIDSTIYAVGYNIAVYSKDLGQTWKKIENIETNKYFYSVNFRDKNNGFITGENGMIYKTGDGGNSWRKIESGIHINILKINFLDEFNLVALTNNNGGISEIYTSDDSGETWSFSTQILENTMKYNLINGVGYFVGGDGKMFKHIKKTPFSSMAGYINGDTVVCEGTRMPYSVIANTNYSYIWEISGNNTMNAIDNSCSVHWLNEGNYNISVTPYNECGFGVSRDLSVRVAPVEIPYISGKDSVMEFENDVLYHSDLIEGNKYQWNISGGKPSVFAKDSVYVNWGKKSKGRVNVVTTSEVANCRSSSAKDIIIFNGVGLDKNYMIYNCTLGKNEDILLSSDLENPTFSLTHGEGDENNTSFEIIKDTLRCLSDYNILNIDTARIRIKVNSIKGTYDRKILLVKYPENIYLKRTICETGSIMVGNSVFNKQGDYRINLINNFGCDSVIHLNLGVNPSDTGFVKANICEGNYIRIAGRYYSSTGVYIMKLYTSSWCDSTIVLDLTVHQPVTTNLNLMISPGDSVLLGNTYFSQQGNYNINLTSKYGCDSTIVLNLTVNNITTINEVNDALEINISPNPVKNKLIITGSGNNSTEISFLIFDISGRLQIKTILEQHTENFEKDINVYDLEKGLYILEIRKNGIPVSKTKFIKK